MPAQSDHADHDLSPEKQPRIETQIHRRRKAKAFSLLESEWDLSQETPPIQLRTPRYPHSTTPDSKRPH
jgi:hypothetical protein